MARRGGKNEERRGFHEEVVHLLFARHRVPRSSSYLPTRSYRPSFSSAVRPRARATTVTFFRPCLGRLEEKLATRLGDPD